MFNYILIYFLAYLLLLGAIVIIGLLRNIKREASYIDSTNSIALQNLVLLIPFRNEAHRIEAVIESLTNSTFLPKEIIFIDDHSTDETAELISQTIKINNYRIIATPERVFGKKAAIRFGIQNSESEYILTTDADITFHSTYFETVSNLQKADMYVLPVTMKAKRLFGELYKIDLILVNAFNVGLAGLKRPIMASGANLLFKRSKFEEYDSFETHKHIASGDDMYLLRDFRESKADIRLISNPDFGVETETPQSFKEFIDQRLRWLGKTGHLNDHLSNALSVFQMVLTGTFFGLLIYYFLIGEIAFGLIVLTWKAILDLILFAPYFNRIKRMKAWLFIPMYEVLFPFYTLLILVLIPFYKPKWKNREIYLKTKKIENNKDTKAQRL